MIKKVKCQKIMSILLIASFMVMSFPLIQVGATAGYYSETFNDGTVDGWTTTLGATGTFASSDTPSVTNKSGALTRTGTTAVSNVRKQLAAGLTGSVVVDFKFRGDFDYTQTGFPQIQVLNLAGGVVASLEVGYNTTSLLKISANGRRDVDPDGAGSGTTTVLDRNKWYRIKYVITTNATAGTLNAYIFDANGNPVQFETNRTLLAVTDVGRINFATAAVGTNFKTGTLYFDDVKIYQNDDESSVAVTTDSLDLASYNSLANFNTVAGDLNLPTVGDNGAIISWTSNNSNVVVNGGVANIQKTSDVQSATLTATATKGNQISSKDFNLSILADTRTDAQKIADSKSGLSLGDISGVTNNLTLLTQDTVNGTIISWASDDPFTISNTGTVLRPIASETNKVVALTATISKGSLTDVKVFNVTVSKNPYTLDSAFTNEISTGWTAVNSTQADVTMMPYTDGAENVYKIAKTVKTSYPQLKHDPIANSNRVAIETRIKTVSGNPSFRLKGSETSSSAINDIIWMSFGGTSGTNANKLYCLNATGTNENGEISNYVLDDYSEGVYYNIKVELDPNTQLIDIYVDGVKKLSGVYYRTTSTKLSYLRTMDFEIANNVDSGDLYVDYVKYYNIYQENHKMLDISFGEGVTTFPQDTNLTVTSKFKNLSSFDMPVCFIVAIYNIDNHLVRVNLSNYITSAKTAYDLSTTVDTTEGNYAKCFVFDNLSNINPYSVFERLPQN